MTVHKFKFEHSKTFWEYQFAEVVAWLGSKNYSVKCFAGARDILDFNSRSVHINSRQRSESKFYTLLHECGHLLISYSSKKFKEDYPVYAFSGDASSTRSIAYQVSLVAEELEAWKRGRRLAKKMGLHVDDEKFNKIMSKCSMSYISAAARIVNRHSTT